MVKVALASLVAAALSTLTIVTFAPSNVDAASACKTRKFETTLVAEACQKAGQAEAKKVMKDWMRVAKKQRKDLACATCHSKVGGAYPLKPVGLKLYKELGGK
jgi:hypothetical protein